MGYEGIFATSDAILIKAGVSVNPEVITEARMNELNGEVESYINSITRNDWSTDFPALTSAGKLILSDLASNLVAIYMIQYSMSSYNSEDEAKGMIKTLQERADKVILLLQDQKVKTFMKGL